MGTQSKTITVPPTDDRVRKDGGNPTDDQRVPPEQAEKTKRKAQHDQTREEPGS